MFTDANSYRGYLEGKEWIIEEGARRFTQVNHTDTLEEFPTFTLPGYASIG